ncbi:MAG: hypothetical protein IJV17_02540 [Prevotella sp.]|nr:hypothetical protein [Prevotella sp.]
MKRLQNKVSESSLALPVTVIYTIVIWLAAGLIREGWWLQLGCMMLSAFLLEELNNNNALIRIHTRMVSCSFLALSGIVCFMFHALEGGLTQLFLLGTYLILFHTYQDEQSPGLTYYGFLFFGMTSIVFVHILYYLPFLWILMLTNLHTFSWRTFFASLMGVITPYWFYGSWLIYQEDIIRLAQHFTPLWDFQLPFDFTDIGVHQIITVAFLFVITLLSMIHFWHTAYLDKFRTRQLFSFLIRMDLLTFLFFCIQPQLGSTLTFLMVINTAPLVAHYIALTHTRMTNILFSVMTVATIALTVYNLWM